jgi:hypothetical protein
MQRLRKERLADLRAGRLAVFDWNALQRFAGFDPTYLHIDKSPKSPRPGFALAGDDEAGGVLDATLRLTAHKAGLPGLVR